MLHGPLGLGEDLHKIHSSHETCWEVVREVCAAPENKALCHSLSLALCVCVESNAPLGFPAHLGFLRASMGTPKSITIQLLDSEVCKTHAKVPCEERKGCGFNVA